MVYRCHIDCMVVLFLFYSFGGEGIYVCMMWFTSVVLFYFCCCDIAYRSYFLVLVLSIVHI